MLTLAYFPKLPKFPFHVSASHSGGLLAYIVPRTCFGSLGK